MIKKYWLIILIGGLGAGCGKQENEAAGQPPSSTPKGTMKPKPLPPALVATWEKAGLSRNDVAAWAKVGFTAGWMGPDKKYSSITFSRSLDELNAPKAVAAFEARTWKLGVLKSLPTPATAFGLYLRGDPFELVQITDAGLKVVAQLQQLTSLSLYRCDRITDAGLKDVAKLQQLTSLNLTIGCFQITDAGVAELRKALPKCEIER